MDILYYKDNLEFDTATIPAVNSSIIARQSPFHNCQNFSIASFNCLLASGSKDYLKTATNFLVNVRDKWGKNYCVIDISDPVYNRLKDIIKLSNFKVEFIVEAPYENYNGSDMILCILNLEKLTLIE